MKRLPPSSVAVLLVLAGLVIGITSIANRNRAIARATNEIKAFGIGIQQYRIDNGLPPQNADTDLLDPRIHFSPGEGSSADLYRKASRHLYSALTGDFEPQGSPDGQSDSNTTAYYTFTKSMLNKTIGEDGQITKVNFLQDPFGNCYGYSTAGLKEEAEFQRQVQRNPTLSRPAELKDSTHRPMTCGRQAAPRPRMDRRSG
jgi:hypothetical protein